MSEPIRTVGELVQTRCDLTLDRDDLAALEAERDDAVAMLGALDAHRIRLNVELERYRDALVRVLRWSTEKNGDLGDAAWWIQGAVRECCAAAGLDPDTLGGE